MRTQEIPTSPDRPAYELDRRRKLMRISKREEWVVASLLDNLNKPWGPNVCTALGSTDYWENPVARRLAVAIGKAMQSNLTKANIVHNIGVEDAPWLGHPTFFKSGLPMEAAEYYAFDLCEFYHGKRLEALIADALVKVQMQPECSREVARALSDDLDKFQ